MAEDVTSLPAPQNSQQFLLSLKEVLAKVKAIEDVQVQEEALVQLVEMYMTCPSQISAKRLLASFFTKLPESRSEFVATSICQWLSCHTHSCVQVEQAERPSKMRAVVDAVAALLENFKLGEQCVAAVVKEIVHFLVKAEDLFLGDVHCDVPPVQLNEVMHHCHVTIQTLNLVLQKTLMVDSGQESLPMQTVVEEDILAQLIDLDLKILANELFLLDCRCCCAMNIILVLQLSLAPHVGPVWIPRLLLPPTDQPPPDLTSCLGWLSDAYIARFNLEQQSTLSFLALTYGYIAMVNVASVLTTLDGGHHFYLDTLLVRLVAHGTRCEDTPSKALYGKTVTLWTNKLLTAVHSVSAKMGTVPDGVRAKLDSASPVVDCLLQFVWLHWEDQLDIVRQSSTAVFENTIKIQAEANAGVSNSFGQFLVSHLLKVSWSSRGKLKALSSCVKLYGAGLIMAQCPHLPTLVLQQFKDQALSSYASELYTSLFISHVKEHEKFASSHGNTTPCARQSNLSDGNTTPCARQSSLSDGNTTPCAKKCATSSLESDWWKAADILNTWAEPLVVAMSSQQQKLKQNILEYLLPKLMRVRAGVLQYLVNRLSSVTTGDGKPCYGAAIMCLRRARVLGLVPPMSAQAVRSASESGQFPWLGQLEPTVLKAALCHSDGQVRLDAFALLCENNKKTEVISQFEFSMIEFFIPHNMNNQKPAFRQAFLALIKKLIFRIKESLSAVCRQIKKKHDKDLELCSQQYVVFLSWMVDCCFKNLYPGAVFAQCSTSLACLSLLTTNFLTEQDGFSVLARLTKQKRQALVDCLMESFEEIRQDALYIMSTCLQQQETIWTREEFTQVLRVAMKLSCGTRPQDCDTAVHLFLLLLRHEDYFPLKAVNLADYSPLPLPHPSCCSTGKTSHLSLLEVLLEMLNAQIQVADTSLITAAANGPMYPTLHCIRYILQDFTFKSLPLDLTSHVKNFIIDLISTCLKLAQVVSPVVQNSSPEGNIPEEAIGGFQGGHIDDLERNALFESLPQYLVVCCWRSIKEVSLTMGRLCQQIPIAHLLEEDSPTCLLSLDKVVLIGKYFSQQLMESIHRGAFELAYAGFQLMCQMLWSHPKPSFHQLPWLWLQTVLEDMQSDQPTSSLCSTRRSAGLPFFVQAITSTEPTLTGRKCFHQVIKDLLDLAQADSSTGLTNSHSQVHALNVLRALFRDARLADDVLPYVASGLRIAILGFKSEQWAVRNSSTLLLSALMTRMFGVKRSKDESDMSIKNCQTGRAFFHRYPQLFPFLLAELKEATSGIGYSGSFHLQPSLYPVLLVLGRLFPSTMEGTDTALSLTAFIPYVIRCAASPVYKTRVIASRALKPLARTSQIGQIGLELLACLPEFNEDGPVPGVSSSLVHGILLQLCQLAELMVGLNQSLQEQVLDALLPALYTRLWLLTGSHQSYAGKQCAAILIDLILQMANSLARPSHQLQQAFFSCLLQQESPDSQLWQPFRFEWEKTKARLVLKHLVRLEICSRIDSPLHLKKSGTTSSKQQVQLAASSHPLPREGLRPGVDCLPSEARGRFYCQQVLSLLRSPLYEVRLETMSTLLNAVTNCGKTQMSSTQTGVGSTADDVEGRKEECDVQLGSVGCGPQWDEAQVDTTSSPGGNDVRWDWNMLDQMMTELFHPILTLALVTETHHQCLEKVFWLLTSLPMSSHLVAKMDISDTVKMFSSLQEKIKQERCVQVKAAMLSFSGHLVPGVYTMTGQTCSLDLLQQWADLVSVYCQLEDNPDLKLSCSKVLLANAHTLLCDPDCRIGNVVLTCWDSLSVLLQDADMKVKDTAASVICVAQGLQAESYHASFALHCLPTCLVSILGRKFPSGVQKLLLAWLVKDTCLDSQDNDGCLFDKGDINTYQDSVSFIRSIMCALIWLDPHMYGTDSLEFCRKHCLGISDKDFCEIPEATDRSSYAGTLSAIGVCPPYTLACAAQEEEVSVGVIQHVSLLCSRLEVLQSRCHSLDRYSNSERFKSLCLTVYQARCLLHLVPQTRHQLHLVPPRQEMSQQLATCFLQLQTLVEDLQNRFNLINILCS